MMFVVFVPFIFVLIVAEIENVIKQPGGPCVIDETMWEYYGNAEFTGWVPRKPKDTGVLVNTLSFEMPNSKRPFCYSFVPATTNPCLTPLTLVDMLTQTIPATSRVILTMDARFGSLAWLQTHRRIPTIAAMSSTAHKYIQLFTLDLKPGELRVFNDGNITISCWYDNKLMVCASNCIESRRVTSIPRRGYMPFPEGKILTDLTMNHLAQLPLDQLQLLSSFQGRPTSGTRSQLAARISHREGFVPVEEESDSDDDDEENYTAKLERQTVPVLTRKCQQLSISSRGNKADLIKRLVNYRQSASTEQRCRQSVKNFNGTLKLPASSDRPFVNKKYSDLFNLVDRYNRLLSSISFPTREKNMKYSFFVNLLAMCVVNSWVVFVEKNHGKAPTDSIRSINHFAVNLAKKLSESFDL